MYSALKRGGVPLYKLARRGVEVEREARDVVVTALELAIDGADRLAFAVTCSKGTYVRVLAADVGRALGTVAHLEQLRRTRVGRFDVRDAAVLPALALLAPGAPLPLVSVRTALADHRGFEVTGDELARLRHGQQNVLARLPAPLRADETALVLGTDGDVAAVIEATGTPTPWRLVRLLGG
jgi:tRNA pseudouridine55 synthase